MRRACTAGHDLASHGARHAPHALCARGQWAASLAFFVFSMVVASREGPFGFLVEHSRNGWSVQIGLDLVISMLVAFLYVAPVARRCGMRVAPWFVVLLLLGSIGLLALVARVRYLQSKVAGLGETIFQ